MSDDALDERYPTIREFSALERSHAALEAQVTNQLSTLNSTMARVEARLMTPVTPPVDHMALAVQRVLDTMAQKQTAQTNPILLALTMLVLIVGAFFVGKMFF